MRTPFPLLGLSLIFWGWQTRLWLPALIMAVGLESAFFLKAKFELSSSDFRNIADLCFLIIVGMLLYAFISLKSARAFLLFLQWLPMGLFPLIAAQALSTAGRVPVKTLFLLTRKTRSPLQNSPDSTVNLSYPYFGIVILAAGAANIGTPWFYWALFLFSVLALWFFRPKRFPLFFWLILLFGAGAVGYGGQLGLHKLQAVLEGKITTWYTADLTANQDPYRTSTAIGAVGALKLSDRILFRVSLPPNGPTALLLREATFNSYQTAVWYAFRAGLQPLLPDKNGTTWKLREDDRENTVLRVSMPLQNGKGLLKLPLGTSQIEELAVPSLSHNPYGVLKVEDGPGLITYQARFNPDSSTDSPPNEADLRIPDKEKAVLEAIAKELELSAKPPQEQINRVRGFFQNRFTYSLNLQTPPTGATPLQHFLTRTHSGHCEYFASATVLLLRAAGLPARYATGFLVKEYSKLEKQYVVRSRHAHAWTLVWYDQAWHEWDTTPPSWVQSEEKSASLLQALSDFWAWGVFKFTSWWQQDHNRILKHFWWLLVPLLIWSAGKFKIISRIRSWTKKQPLTNARLITPGSDSEFYQVERMLADRSLPRLPSETLSAWLKRVAEAKPGMFDFKKLEAVLDLHYQYRFDPIGITPAERLNLKKGIDSWLESERKREKEESRAEPQSRREKTERLSAQRKK